MKNLLRFFFLMVSIAISTSLSLAQWVQTSGPQSEDITVFAMTDENIFAGTKYSGIFLSTNNGATWTHLDNGLISVSVTCFAKIDTNLFVGTEGGGVFFSTDNGTSGIPVSTGLETVESRFISSLAVSSNKLFANTWGGLFLSTNKGANWTYISQLNNLTGGPLLVNQNNDGSTSIYVGDYTGLYRSINDGTTLTKLNNPPTMSSDPYITALAVVSNNSGGTYLFAGTWGDGVFRTSNDGTSWQKCNTGLVKNWSDHVYVNNFAVNGSNLFVAENLQGDFECGVFLSPDFGATWTSKNSELKNRDVVALAVKDNNLFAGTNGAGVFRSTNNGTNWTQVNTGMSYQYVNALAIHGPNLYAGTGNGGVFLSTDRGANWSQMNNNTDLDINSNIWPISAITITNNNCIFAGTNQGLYHSSDNGIHWEKIDYTSGIFSNVCIWSLINVPNGTDSSYIFAGTLNEGIYRSNNNGDRWDPVNTGLWADTRNYIVYALVAGPNASGGTNIYAGMGHQGINAYGEVYRSTNYASSWTKMSNGLPKEHIWSLAISGTNVFAGTKGSGIYRSTMNGASWTAVNEGLTSTIISALAVSNSTIFAGTYDTGIFYSSNNGDSWSPFNENLTNLSINALVADDTYLYAGTVEGGVWKRPHSEISTVESATKEIPTQFSLAQNYPNPFNPRTTIEYSVPTQVHITLQIFDILGRDIATLVNEKKLPGMYEVNFDGSYLPSGVYYYQLRAEQYNETKKLLLIK